MQVRYPKTYTLDEFNAIENNTFPKPKFKAGDKVIYTNDYGVCWGEREILRAEFWQGDGYIDWKYYINEKDSHWAPVSEKNLKLIEN